MRNMSPERWPRVKELFDSTLDLDPESRSRFLDVACEVEPELREQVDRLLREHDSAPAAFLATGSGARLLHDPLPFREDLLLKDRYRIQHEIGQGGSGVVYLAQDLQLLERPVVVKFLHGQAQRHPVLRARFRQELEALARIRHPGVVCLLDVGELPAGEMYLVMEFVDGDTLRAQIGNEGIALERAARIISHISCALMAAHEQGVFHRDLKPENVMLVRGAMDDAIKLIDFGIAKVEQAQAQAHTETWTFMGTINYVAPEQLLGQSGAAADVWALGIIAFELVTGRRPFQPETPFHLFEMQKSGRREDPGRLRPELPLGARTAILKALSFEPADRQPSPAAFAREFADGIKGRLAWAALFRRVARASALWLAILLVIFTGRKLLSSARAKLAAKPPLLATSLSINTPLGVAADRKGNVYFSEYANNRVWRVDPNGHASVLAGTGIAGFTGNGGPAVSAAIQAPRILAVHGEDYLYVVETTSDRIRRVHLKSGIIEHVLGNGRPQFNGDGRTGTQTGFSEGLGIAIDPSGNLFFCDTNNHRIRRLSAQDGLVTTVAGTGVAGWSGDRGPADQARLFRPSGLALHPSGDIYFYQVRPQLIRRIRNGVIETVAGSESSPAMEGPALAVRLGASTGLAIEPSGRHLYFTEESFDTLRKLDLATGRITVVAGTGVQGYSGDGGPARNAMMANPTGITIDWNGNIYIADAMGNRIRKIDPRGIISTFAGGMVPYSLLLRAPVFAFAPFL
ncbi:MAG: protein kinase [Acidobacteria bacterium]|nr:protein kinase [Acidobacteriota bacterium]